MRAHVGRGLRPNKYLIWKPHKCIQEHSCSESQANGSKCQVLSIQSRAVFAAACELPCSQGRKRLEKGCSPQCCCMYPCLRALAVLRPDPPSLKASQECSRRHSASAYDEPCEHPFSITNLEEARKPPPTDQ